MRKELALTAVQKCNAGKRKTFMPEFESARFAAKSDYENFQQLFVSSRNEADTYKAADIWFALEALEGSPCRSSVIT